MFLKLNKQAVFGVDAALFYKARSIWLLRALPLFIASLALAFHIPQKEEFTYTKWMFNERKRTNM